MCVHFWGHSLYIYLNNYITFFSFTRSLFSIPPRLFFSYKDHFSEHESLHLWFFFWESSLDIDWLGLKYKHFLNLIFIFIILWHVHNFKSNNTRIIAKPVLPCPTYPHHPRFYFSIANTFNSFSCFFQYISSYFSLICLSYFFLPCSFQHYLPILCYGRWEFSFLTLHNTTITRNPTCTHILSPSSRILNILIFFLS